MSYQANRRWNPSTHCASRTRWSEAWALDGSAAPQKADGRKHSLAVGRAASDRRSAATVKGSEERTISVQRVDSQAILSERRGPSEGGLPGSALQGAAAALVDSRTRRIMPGGECLCGEPPHLERVDQLSELRLHSERFSQVGRVPRSSRGRLCTKMRF